MLLDLKESIGSGHRGKNKELSTQFSRITKSQLGEFWVIHLENLSEGLCFNSLCLACRLQSVSGLEGMA